MQLHLGHLAKSFALKEVPTKIGRQQQKRHDQKPATKKRKQGLGQAWASAGKHGLSLGDRLKKNRAAGERDRRPVGIANVGVSEFGAG
eukprot:12097-Prymnesium_polylepis.2